MRLFRTMIVLAGVAFFMPSPPEDPAAAGTAQADPGTSGLISSATLAVVDAAGFCSRQPTVCQTAGYVSGKLEAKAKYSVKLIYEWANKPSGSHEPAAKSDLAASDPLKTGAIRPAAVRVAGSQSTLTIEDLIPEWRGPAAPRKG